MVVCKFFLEGNCKFGNRCRNEHPQNTSFASQNRFGALQNTSTPSRFGGGNEPARKETGWNINPNDVRNDLTDGKGRPKWILSTYGPGRGTPSSLLDGNEFSPEEVRVRFYELASSGKENEGDQEAIALWSKAEQAMNDIANNSDNVVKFMEEAEQKHPNRYDFCNTDGTKTRAQVEIESQSQNGASSGFGAGSGFGQIAAPSNPFSKPPTSAFGQPSGPSAFGSSAFGKPAFGQSGFGGSPSQSTTTAFGQPAPSTAFGQQAAPSVFGKPAFGQSAFGQPAQPASAFGQATQPTSAFGQSSQATSAFGQPAFGSSGFGQGAQKSNPFAAPSASSGFGQASQSSTTFGQPSQPTSAFGQPSQPTSTFGQQSQPVSAFGQPSQPTSAFGQPSQPTSAFGQPSQPTSAFGQPSQPTSAFGQTSQPVSAFGQPSQPGQASNLSTAFGQPASTGSAVPAFGSGSTTSGVFGKGGAGHANPFGVQSTSTNPNDQSMDAMSPRTSRPVSRDNPFSQPTTQSSSQQTATQPAQPARQGSLSTASSKPNTNNSATPHPLTGRPPRPLVYTETLPLRPNQTNASKQLASYRGQRVQYSDGVPCYQRPDGRGWEKVWFPEAGADPTVVPLNRDDKLDDLQGTEEQYTDDVKNAYKYLFDEGKFKNGQIPLIPPMRDWCLYDF